MNDSNAIEASNNISLELGGDSNNVDLSKDNT